MLQVTSDHVSSYVAMKFAEDNKRGSLEALRLVCSSFRLLRGVLIILSAKSSYGAPSKMRSKLFGSYMLLRTHFLSPLDTQIPLLSMWDLSSIRIQNSQNSQISKIHLNDRGKLILVDLEPCLEENKKSKNDMLHWRSWQEICIEVCIS
jgi:hypothetical protein